ncbi:MAG: hypothetical protein WKG03_00220 [Telluria sp.]
MNMRARLQKLEASTPTDARAGLHPDLWPLIGSRYTHEYFIELIAAEAANAKEAEIGNT